MTKEEMRDKLANALSDFVYAVRNESTAEYETSNLADTLIDLIETREPKRWLRGPGPR